MYFFFWLFHGGSELCTFWMEEAPLISAVFVCILSPPLLQMSLLSLWHNPHPAAGFQIVIELSGTLVPPSDRRGPYSTWTLLGGPPEGTSVSSDTCSLLRPIPPLSSFPPGLYLSRPSTPDGNHSLGKLKLGRGCNLHTMN